MIRVHFTAELVLLDDEYTADSRHEDLELAVQNEIGPAGVLVNVVTRVESMDVVMPPTAPTNPVSAPHRGR